MAEMQVIPARHGTATFVPAGQIIKIVNTSGTQVVDTWAFALPKPEPKKDAQAEESKEEKKEESKEEAPKETPKKTPKKKGGMDLPSQEDAEKATEQGVKEGEEATNAAKTPQKSTWASYVPSVGWSSSKSKGGANAAASKEDTEQQKDSKTWASYFPSGKGYSSYIPKSATDTVSSFASIHQRDTSKSYIQQLQDFSKTPVGAAGWSGMAALTGSGYGGSAYAGYQAYAAASQSTPSMEFMSMGHSRAATLHMRPRVNDTLVSNLREPILTLVEDSSQGIHDTLVPACDPARYKGLGVDKWEEHGSCAENLVLALKELNERAGLKGPKAVGADVTINSVPPPLNLFMNIPWDDAGDIGFSAPKCKANDYVRLKAERDVVVVMSACPQDILDINAKNPTDAHFLVEEDQPTEAIKRTSQVKKRPPPRKISSSHATSTVGSVAGSTTSKKPIPQRRAVPAKKTDGATPAAGAPKPAQPAKKKPVPKAVAPQKKPTPAAAPNNANGSTDAAAPVEKKKPKKLAPRAKPAAAAET